MHVCIMYVSMNGTLIVTRNLQNGTPKPPKCRFISQSTNGIQMIVDDETTNFILSFMSCFSILFLDPGNRRGSSRRPGGHRRTKNKKVCIKCSFLFRILSICLFSGGLGSFHLTISRKPLSCMFSLSSVFPTRLFFSRSNGFWCH